MRHVAIVLAAGKGSRMKSDIPKQFLEIDGKPVLYYSLRVMEDSFIDEVVLVTGTDQVAYCKTEIVERYGFSKVSKVVAGGAERYHSVYQGLLACEDADYVYIHDGARPFISQQIMNNARANVEQYQACAAGMPVKDTIKIVDASGFAVETPQRSLVWQVQTPQVFSYKIVRQAYDKLLAMEEMPIVTDDTMVVETMTAIPVKLFDASYENIKITTPEDLGVAEVFVKNLSKIF
ncbi:MAG: 2-C-methyl-D-erythritol 4-phosphate cytidylyltransferase [Eubacterium sp.]|nr:2-C-methyl-D-erythritol 4-phosphate cytidylyltransferase [Eubacterium sp.]